MRRPALAHGVILIVVLVAAFFTWTRDRKSGWKSGQVDIFEFSSIRRIVFESTQRRVVIDRAKDKAGLHYWVSIVLSAPASGSKQEPKDSKAPVGKASNNTVQFFKGNQNLVDAIDEIRKFRAERDIGRISETDLEQFGLASGAARLTITGPKKEKVLLIGNHLRGSDDLYVKEVRAERVLIAGGPLLSGITLARHRFRDQTLTSFSENELTEVALQAKGRSRRIYRSATRDQTNSAWSANKQAKTSDEKAGHIVSRLLALRAQNYLKSDLPPEISMAATVEYHGSSERLDRLIIFKSRPVKGTNAKKYSSSYYARTEHTRKNVELSSSDTTYLIDEIENWLEEKTSASGTKADAHVE